MGLIYDTSVSDNAKTLSDAFNKIAVSTESLFERVKGHGAAVAMNYEPIAKRSFSGQVYFPLPYSIGMYDTDGFWNSSSPEKFTIPVGFSYAQAWSFVRYKNGNWKNSVHFVRSGNEKIFSQDTGLTTNKHSYSTASSPIMAVTPGDTLYASIFQSAAGTYALDDIFLADYSGTLSTEQASPMRAVFVIRGFQ